MKSLRNVSRASAKFMSLDNICLFPDADGNFNENRVTFCAELPITSSEYANAGLLDIRATVSLVIDSECDDETARTIRYKGATYAVYRRYPMANGLTQLYLEEKAGIR